MTESKQHFITGDKVFAKMKGYPPWPARVIALANESPHSKRYHVHFYGTNQTAVVKGENICVYIENKSKLAKPKKQKYFAQALKEIEAELNVMNSGLSDVTVSTSEQESSELSSANTMVTVVSDLEDTIRADAEGVSTISPPPSFKNKKKLKKRMENTSLNDLKRKAEQSASEGEHSNRKRARKLSAALSSKGSSPTGNSKKFSSSHSKMKSKDFPDGKMKSNDQGDQKLEKNDQKVVSEFNSDISKIEKMKLDKERFVFAYINNVETAKIPLNLNRPHFSNEESADLWDESVLQYANSLKKRIEAGENLPNIIELMDEWTTMKSVEILKQNVSDVNLEKIRFLRTEAQLLDVDIEIKNALGLDAAHPQKCLELLDKMSQLLVMPLMLKKQPHVMNTIRRMRNYVGNTSTWSMDEKELEAFKVSAEQIRLKSEEIYNKFKNLFNSSDSLHFWEYFKNQVQLFQNKTSTMSLQETLSLVEEPV